MKIIVAYVPALHQGYLDFFKKHGGDLYILDLSLVREVPRLERDIRAVSAEQIAKAITALSILPRVAVLTKENLNQLPAGAEVVMPDEDVSRHFVETYLPGRAVQFDKVFLRWEGHSAKKENIPINPNRIISELEFDQEMMGQAYVEAGKSIDWWRQVGAVLVKDGQVLFTAYNRAMPSDQVHNIFGDPRSNFDYGVAFELSKFMHAETSIIAEAAKRGTALDGASIYVTTFPCPACAKSIVVAGIKKVYYKEGYSLLDAEDILQSVGAEIIQVK